MCSKCSNFTSLIDETMIATILGPISTSFNSFTNLSWIATIYIIGMSASQPLTGHLSEIFGRWEGLIICNVIFAIGTLICGLSTSLPILLLGRAVQGFGGGSVSSIAAIIETDLVSLRNRGITEGIGGIMFGVGLAVGGLWGGGINDAIGWRWAFLIQVPITAASTAVVWLLVHVPKKKSALSTFKRVDFIGSISLLAAVIFLQVGLDAGGNTLPWTHPLVLASLPLAVVFFAIFLYWDLYCAPYPLIPIRILCTRNVALACIVYAFTMFSYYSNIFYVPIYLQVQGHSSTQTGLRFITQAAGAAVATSGAGLFVKWKGKYYFLNVLCQVAFILGTGLLITLNLTSRSWQPFVFLALTGIGFGGVWVTTLMGMLSAISEEHQAVVQSATYCIRSISMVIGLAISAAAFQKVLKANLEASLGPQDSKLIGEVRTNFSAVQSLSPDLKLSVQRSYIDALHVVFYITTAEIVVAAIASLMMKENDIPDTLK